MPLTRAEREGFALLLFAILMATVAPRLGLGSFASALVTVVAFAIGGFATAVLMRGETLEEII